MEDVRLLRRLRQFEPSTFWSARLLEYVIERWDPTGRLMQRIERTATWFPPRAQTTAVTPTQPPNPRVVDFIIRDSLLFTMVWYPADNFGRFVQQLPSLVPGIPSYRTTRADGLYSTIIEVIDLTSGTVLFTRRYLPMFMGFLDADHAYSYAETDDGFPHYNVWRFTFTR